MQDVVTFYQSLSQAHLLSQIDSDVQRQQSQSQSLSLSCSSCSSSSARVPPSLRERQEHLSLIRITFGIMSKGQSVAVLTEEAESDDDALLVMPDGVVLDDQDLEDQEEELASLFPIAEQNVENHTDIGRRAARDCVSKGTRFKYYGIVRQAGALCKFFAENPLEPRPAHTEPDFNFAEHAHYAGYVADGSVPRPMPLTLVKFFLGHCERRMVSWKYHVNPLQQKHLSPGAINNIITAVRDTYRLNEVDVDPAINKFCRNFMGMYTRMIGVEKNKTPPAFPVKSGASSISNEAASMLFLNACKMGTSQGKNRSWVLTRMLWPFLLICWCTLGRGERVASLGYDMISWAGDALTIQIPTSKTDPQGLRSYGKRCYANPIEPACCIVLALAVLVFSRSALEGPFQYVFGVSNVRNMMNDLLKILVASLSASGLISLGCAIFEITLHTFKKSAMQFCTGGEGVKEMQLELRADHKICRTQSAYLKDTVAYSEQDGLIGRTLSQLPAGEVAFNTRAPHFLKHQIDAIEWSELLPHYNSLPSNFKNVVPFLVASIVYHEQWLRDTLPTDHPIFRSKLFTTHSKEVRLFKPLVHGGNLDEGDLPLTGRYMAGDACAFAKVAVHEIQAHRVEFNRTQLSAQRPCVVEVPPSVLASSAPFTAQGLEACITKAVGAGITIALEQMHKDAGLPASAPVTTASWPIQHVNVPALFRIGAQTRADEAWRQYFNCSMSGGSPLRFVTCEMLPPGPQLQSQKVALSRLKKVCQAILGKTDPNVVARNSETYFLACYKQFNEVMQFPETWSISYIYDQMHKPNKAEALKAAMQATAFGASDVQISQSPSPWKHKEALTASQQLSQLPVTGRKRQYKQLPADYKVPTCKIRDTWDCWFHGSASSPPLKDIQMTSRDLGKVFVLDKTANFSTNQTTLYKAVACINALNTLGVCDLCIISNSEKYFNEGCSNLQERIVRCFPDIIIRTLSTGYLYDKLMFCNKTQRTAVVDAPLELVVFSVPNVPIVAPGSCAIPVAKRSKYVASV